MADIIKYQGEDFIIPFEIADDNGNAIDLTTLHELYVYFILYSEIIFYYSKNSHPGYNIITLDDSNGFTIAIPSTMTKDLRPGILKTEVILINSSNVRSIITNDSLIIRKSFSRKGL
jgi:hypothetical protein